MVVFKKSAFGTVCSRQCKHAELPATSGEAVSAPPCLGSCTQVVRRIGTRPLPWSATQPPAEYSEARLPSSCFCAGSESFLRTRGSSSRLLRTCRGRFLIFCLLAVAFCEHSFLALADSGSGVRHNVVTDSGTSNAKGISPTFRDTADPLSSFLELIEQRKKAWAASLSKAAERTPAVHCGSALYGGTHENGTSFVNPKEAANCRSLCRALLHKHGTSCMTAADPYACLLSFRSERWVPKEYRDYCVYTKPTVQQPDFEKSNCSEKCLRIGMNTWLGNILRGDVSWDLFVKNVPSSCRFNSIAPKASGLAARAKTNFSKSMALSVLLKTSMTRFHIITRKLTSIQSDWAQVAESAIVPGEYWDSLSAAGRLGWTVTKVFFAPADDSQLSPLLQKLSGSSTGEAICLFKLVEAGIERFGMVPGRSCPGSIGVLLVAALKEYPTPDFDAASSGFDLCVARRVFQSRKPVDGSVLEPLQLKTRVTIGSPCGISSGMENGMWEVAFYASLYPQARDIDGIPSSGDCPWKGSFQLNSKCFLKLNRDIDPYKLDFFSANAACRGLAEGTGFAPEDASLAVVDSDRELSFLGEMLSEGESWIGFFQPGQTPLVSPGNGDQYRIDERECAPDLLQSADGLGSTISAIKKRCRAAWTWPAWKSVAERGLRNSWNVKFCDSHPQTLDSTKYADCATMNIQSVGPPCLKARSCDATYPTICSLKLRTGPEVLSLDANGSSVLPVLDCKSGEDCWLEFSFPTVDSRKDFLLDSSFVGREYGNGFVALMLFCGEGPMLAGPWRLTRRTNIGLDSSFKEVADGVYEICFCSSVRVGDDMMACSDGKEFRYVRGLLRRYQDNDDTILSPDQLEVTLKPLAGAATEGSLLFMLPQPNEISAGVVYCSIDRDGQTTSTCKFALHSTGDAERSVTLSFVPVNKSMNSAAVCTHSGVSMTAKVEGTAEIEVVTLVPSSIKYAVCGDGSLVGTLIFSAKVNPDVNPNFVGTSFAESLQRNNQILKNVLRGVKTYYPDDHINNAYLQVDVGGYWNAEAAESSVLALIEAQHVKDVNCPNYLSPTVMGYSGTFDAYELNLVFKIPAPILRATMCLFNVSPSYEPVVALGRAPLSSTPEKIQTFEGRCSLAPARDCAISLYPDVAKTSNYWKPFFPPTIAVKLLKGDMPCPNNPDDSQYDVFTGDPDNTKELLSAAGVAMTRTHVSDYMLEFTLDEKLRAWLADAEVATICMTQDGLSSASTRCWESERCTKHLGYMRWTGPTREDPTRVFICEQGLCVVDVKGKNMDFLSMNFGRLAALESCGKIGGKGTLQMSGSFNGVELFKPSDEHSVHATFSTSGGSSNTPSSTGSSSTTMDGSAVSFVIEATSDYDSLELCWNPVTGTMHNMLDHTVSVGFVVFPGHITLKSMETTEKADFLVGKPVVVSIEASMKRSMLVGSTKVYVKDAPKNDSFVDTCDYQKDVAANLITTFVSVSSTEDAAGGYLTGHFIVPYPALKSSVCLVQFLLPEKTSMDRPYSTYLGRLPGVVLPSARANISCGLDTTFTCKGEAAVQRTPGLSANGTPLSILSSIPSQLDAFLVPHDSCPANPNDMNAPSSQGVYPERLSGEFTSDYMKVSLDRTSLILFSRGTGSICLVDTHCDNPDGGGCVSTFGTGAWIGPFFTHPIDITCTTWKEGVCEVAIQGFSMTLMDFNIPRLAVAENCGGSRVADGVLQNIGAERAVFGVRPVFGWGYKLCWNIASSVDTTVQGHTTDDSNFNKSIGTIHFMPLPVLKNRSINRRSVVDCTVIITVSALLDENTARSLGGTRPAEGLWNEISREPFTDGQTCSSKGTSVNVQVRDISMETAPIRNRQEGSAEETGNRSKDQLVALMSLEIDPPTTPYTYCWHTVLIGKNSQTLHESWTPLISVPKPSRAQLGGIASSTALSLGFVPCTFDTSDPAVCNFSVSPVDYTDTALFPHGELWILPRRSSLILLPGGTECPNGTTDVFSTATPLDNSVLDPNKPLLLPAETSTDHLSYRFDVARSWLSLNGSAAICWRNDDAPEEVVKISRALWLGPLYDREPMNVTCAQTAACTILIKGKNLTKMDNSFSRVAILKKCGEGTGPGIANLRSTTSGSASFITLTSSDAPKLLTANNLEPVHFWALPMKVFQTRCKHRTSPEFVEANWIDSRGICSPIDVAGLLNTRCSDVKQCAFVPLGSQPTESRNDLDPGFHLLIPDSCDDMNYRKLQGTYRCVVKRAISKSQPPFGEDIGAPAMLHLSNNDDDTNASTDDSTSIDQSMSFWVPREEPGVYEICWNSALTATDDPSAYSKSLGVLEMLTILSVIDEAVVCSSKSFNDCSFEITIEIDKPLRQTEKMGLIIAEQDGKTVCEPMSSEKMKDVLIWPHSSSWNSSKSKGSLTYTTSLPMESRKLCVILVGEDASPVGSLQYVGNIPGYSAPKEFGQKVCTADPNEQCAVILTPDKVSNYFALDNRTPEQDKSSPSFDAFDHLLFYLEASSSLYALEGDVSCPASPSDATYQQATENPKDGVAQLIGDKTRIDSFSFELSEKQKSWLSSVGELTLCWSVPSCTDDSFRNGTRPCAKKVGMLIWAGPITNDPLPRIACKSNETCAFTVKGVNLASLNHDKSRVAFLKQCGSDEGAGIGNVTEYPRGYTNTVFLQGRGLEKQEQSFLALRSRFTRHWKSPVKHRRTRLEKLHRMQQGLLSLLEANSWQPAATVDSLTVTVPAEVQRVLSVCWNPLATPTDNLSDFTIKVGEVFSYGLVLVDALCTSGSTCGIEVTFKAMDVDAKSLKIRAFTGQCGRAANVAKQLPNDGQFILEKGTTYSLGTPIKTGSYSTQEYSLCWCDQSITPRCEISDYLEFAGTLNIITMEEVAVTCLNNSAASCKVSIPASLGHPIQDSFVYVAELTSSKESSCVTPVFVLPMAEGTAVKDVVELSFNYSSFEALGLKGKKIALCWTSHGSPGSSVPVWNTSFIGSILTVDSNIKPSVLYMGIPATVSINVTGLLREQASKDGIPNSLRKLYLKDKNMCSSTKTSVSLSLTMQSLSPLTGGSAHRINFVMSEAIRLSIPQQATEAFQLSLCSCNSGLQCSSPDEFVSELAQLIIYGPATGVVHECTHDSTCLMSIKDIPGLASLSLRPQLLIRNDCANSEAETELPDGGVMPLRRDSLQVSQQSDAATIFEEHSYGFNDFVLRDQFSGKRQLQKRICYCSDLVGCTPHRLVDIGQITITDVWNTTFRVAIFSQIKVPFTVKSPLHQGDSNQILRVTRGSYSETCELDTVGNACTISFLRFPDVTWSSEDPAFLEYYDSSIPRDSIDNRPSPFIKIASLTPSGPWQNNYKFFCQLGGICEITLNVANKRDDDKVAMLSNCGVEGPHSVGFSQVAEAVAGTRNSVMFRWTKPLNPSSAEVQSGMVVCWKAIEDEAAVTDSFTEYSAEFGTVSIRGILPNQDRTCYVGAVCKLNDLQVQNVESDTRIKLLHNGCGTNGSEWDAAPNNGLMALNNVVNGYAAASLPGILPVLGVNSLFMCACTERDCTVAENFGWHVGNLAVKGPESQAPLVSVFATEDVSLSLVGEFDNKFYLVLKPGDSCASELSSSLNLQGFAPVVEGKATWSAFEEGAGVLSVCICHDTVAGVVDPFGTSHDLLTFCEDATNYAAKVGQLFVNGPIKSKTPFRCSVGSICDFSISWMALKTDDVRDKWAKSKVYIQQEDCRVSSRPLVSDGSFIGDDVIGDTKTSADPAYTISYDVRQSVFMFRNAIDLLAGTYKVCWKSETGNIGLELGYFNVQGPLRDKTAMQVVIGEKFTVEVHMNNHVTEEEAAHYRIRAYAYKGDNIFDNFDCKAQQSSPAKESLACDPANGPPSAVRNDDQGSKLLWENVCVISDELTLEASVGDMFAICFCDGSSLGCDSPNRFGSLVQAWKLSGPKPLDQATPSRYRAGPRFSLDIEGLGMKSDAVIGFSPAFNILNNSRYTCRSADKEILGRFVGSVSDDGRKATFKDVHVPFTIAEGLLCWCPAGPCLDAADFNIQLSHYSVAGPTFTVPRTLVDSYFTVQLTGAALNRNDVITIRRLTDICGNQDTENMDPELVLEEEDRTLNSLGTVESFSSVESAATGEEEITWTSWPMRIKDTVSGLLKICYCSAMIVACGSPGSVSIFAGILEIRGPSKGDVELVASEEHGQYLIVRGKNLSTKNLLTYFQYPSGQTTLTRQQEADICTDPTKLAGGTVTYPDAVNASGTEQYFSVTVAVGKEYVACWSYGGDTTSMAQSMTRQDSAESFLVIEELMLTRESPSKQETTPLQSDPEAVMAVDDKQGSPVTKNDISITSNVSSKDWFFVSIFSQMGFQQGIHNVVVGHEDTVVLTGVINATDTYEAVLGKSHELNECKDIFANSSLQSQTRITTHSASASRLVLQMESTRDAGWHKLCIRNTTASEVFDGGTVEVTTYFQRTGVGMFDTRRTFVLPCVTRQKDSAGNKVWNSPQVWLPDGTGLWTAEIIDGVPGTTKEYPTLNVNSSPKKNFFDFPELRNVLACETTKDQEILVLGATHMLFIYPDSKDKQPVLINHGVAYPADLAIANDQVFITSFDSHLITSFSLKQPEKIIFYDPSNPTLLSAGGIQAIQSIDGKETSIFITDPVGGMIGRLQVSSDDLKNTPAGGKITREWTAVFGKQKSGFSNTEGVNRPFCVGEFVTDYSTQEKMNPLLVVGELISDRITFLSLDNRKLSFYRQINLGVTKLITGLRVRDKVMLLTSKQWSVDQELGRSEVLYVTLSQLIDHVYFTYPDFTKNLQAGLRYQFTPLVTGYSGQEIQFFKEDVEAGDPLQSMGFTLDTKTGQIEGVLTATVTSKVVIVGGDLLGSYTWSFEFEAGCQSGEYFNDSSNKCQPCPLGTFRDEEAELQYCKDHKSFSTTLQKGSTNQSQCACIEGYEIGQLGYCQACPAGTYKTIAADAKCTGRCPQHMSSEKMGADSLEALDCQCDPGFYLTESGCQSCQVGTYCEGSTSPPVKCPEFQTTSGSASTSFEDCVCVEGYYRNGNDCIPCSILTYKTNIGNHACTPCPQPAASLGEEQNLLTASNPETAMFSSKKGAIHQSECEVCASGFYFDSVSVGGCAPCKKNYYCPGFQLGLVACKNNSVTEGEGGESTFHCGCPKGYGKIADRSPMDLTLICKPCPNNYFQHLDGADTECIPCPTNSMTKSAMSTSITSCVAKPGFSAVENLQALTNREGADPTEGSTTSTFLEAIELAKEVEQGYDHFTKEDIFIISVFCKEDSSAAQEYDMPEFVTTLYTSSFEDCQKACLRNVYCTSFSFSKEDMYPTHTNSIMNYTGIYTNAYWPCSLYLFGRAAGEHGQGWTPVRKGIEVEHGKAKSCIVGRVKEELSWQRFQFVECPPNAYCPGDKEANIFECKDYAVTISSGAYSGDHCLCVPGREPVGQVCEQCKIGYYKNTTDNVACTECPQFFTTSITASTSAYECACQSGMYMAPAGTTEDEEVKNGKLETSPGVDAEPAALETMVQARSLRELGKHGEVQAFPFDAVSMAELLRLPWLQEETRKQLEKVAELGVCMPCHSGMFCPGLWKDPPTNSTHMPPQLCIEGSNVPLSTVNADSVEKCLCLAGYAYGRSSGTDMDSDSYFTCSKCSPGTYKELQENAPCSGRCMKDAETYPGAVSKTQCFCQVGRYAVESDDSEGLFSCMECVKGGVCIGGFKQNVIDAIEKNPEFANIIMSDHTIPYPQKGWFATFKPISKETWRPDSLPYTMDSSDTPFGFLDASVPQGTGMPTAFVESEYDRVPDIHPCPIDSRCNGGPTNSCAEGGCGYLCSKCERGYDVSHRGAVCSKCESLWFELVSLIAARLIFCIIAWVIAAVSCLAVQNPSCIHPILIRIWLSNLFLFSLFGVIPDNSVSALADWTSVYRAFFTYPISIFTKYPKVFCILDELGFPLDFKRSWYLQKFAQMLVPLADICILILICGISLIVYKVYKHSKIQRVKLVLSHAQEVHAGDVWAMRTVEKIQDSRCLGLFHYISPQGATRWQKIVRFFSDLVPVFMIIWFWSLPFLVIECTQLLGCVSISYKNEAPLSLLTALPEQECSLKEPWFLAGVIAGSSGILVWGIGSVIVFCVCMLYSDNADNMEARFRYGFLSNGYEFQYRAWEMVLMARKLACACLLTLQLNMNAVGTQEIFRNSVSLLIATLCLILQLLIEPYDRRSHNLTNRVEFMGLLTNVVNCIIIQGSFSFSFFNWLGSLPVITAGLFHMYIFWSLFVEAGRMVLMRPHLARLPSPWRYFNLVTRSLARLYTQGNAKVYYNYITKEMVLEAATKSRVFHIRRMIQRKKKITDYRKINYENRTYFVSALTDSLSRLVISWCQFTIPGDWLDFTIRYSFCYCFWMRHRAASLREPLDLEEFEALRPSLFNDCYVETDEGDDDALLALEIECNEVEAEFLDMMFDDDVYDDSPITLMELYVAVQSMRYIPKGQLRRLHLWYRERMAAAGGSDMSALRKENEELEAELQQLSDVLRSCYGVPEADSSLNILDFFFTVEMVHEAEAESMRLRKEIDAEIVKIRNSRAARAVAERVHMVLKTERENEKTDEESDSIDKVLKSLEENISQKEERTEYLQSALAPGKKKVKARGKGPVEKRRLASLDKRKRVLRPGFSREGQSEGRRLVSLLGSKDSTTGLGRTISPVGSASSGENGSVDGSLPRRIKISLGGMEGSGIEGSDGSQEMRPRRVSLALAASDAYDQENSEGKRTLRLRSDLSSDEGSGTGGARRTLSPVSIQLPAEQSKAARTLTLSFIQRPSFEGEEESSGSEAPRRKISRVGEGESSGSVAPRRRVSRVGTTAPVEQAQATPSPKEAQPLAKRSIGLVKPPPKTKDGDEP